jgi:hypothetical protein
MHANVIAGRGVLASQPFLRKGENKFMSRSRRQSPLRSTFRISVTEGVFAQIFITLIYGCTSSLSTSVKSILPVAPPRSSMMLCR